MGLQTIIDTSEECIYNQLGITYYCLVTGYMKVIAITGYSVPILDTCNNKWPAIRTHWWFVLTIRSYECTIWKSKCIGCNP